MDEFTCPFGKRIYLCQTFQVAEKCSSNYWFGSSVWLEYVPVTHGVAGSSPVRTANEEFKSL